MRSDEASAAGDQISRHGEVRVSKKRADLRVGRSISERRSQPVSRILSAFARHSAPFGARRRTTARRSFLWDRDCSRFLATYPVARTGRPSGDAFATLFGLAPCGVLPATGVTASAVRSYRTFSPLPTFALRATVGKPRERPALRSTRSVRRRAVCFLCHFPSGCPARALPGALPCGVRTFLSFRHLTERWLSEAAVVWPAATSHY